MEKKFKHLERPSALKREYIVGLSRSIRKKKEGLPSLIYKKRESYKREIQSGFE